MRYTEDTKLQTVIRYKNGELGTELCKELGISRSTLWRWSQSFGGIASDYKRPSSPKNLHQLIHQIERKLKLLKFSKL